jgi:hypothetical protein
MNNNQIKYTYNTSTKIPISQIDLTIWHANQTIKNNMKTIS